MAELVTGLEEEYVKNRDELLCEDGSVRTPELVLRDVAKEYATPVHMEFHEIHISKNERAYQVEMYVGRVRGRGEASRRKLAIQIAAADLLSKVENQGFEIPPYGLVPGARISPNIFADLLALCEVLVLSAPFYVQIPDDPELVPEYLYTYKCQIGQLIHFGKSDSRYIAKRLAAKATYEALTGEDYPLEPVSSGAHCNLLEKFKIVPQNSQKKIDIMKYREQCRQKEVLKNSGGAASGSSSQVKDEDDFGDDEEMIPSANPDDKEGAKDRVAKLNLHDIRSRIDNLTLGEQELNPEDEK